MDDETLRILRLVQEGVISAAEAEDLLDALGEPVVPSGLPEPAEVDADEMPSEDWSEPLDDSEKDLPAGPPKPWMWAVPLAGGFVLLAVAGLLTAVLVQGGTRLGWLACTLPLMLFGTLVAILAWWSRTARWLHLYVREEGTPLRLSLPLPLRLSAWVLRWARRWVPQLQETGVDEVIMALAEMDVEGNVLLVEVDDGEEEQVQIYIG
jgi:hypothetical protein